MLHPNKRTAAGHSSVLLHLDTVFMTSVHQAVGGGVSEIAT